MENGRASEVGGTDTSLTVITREHRGLNYRDTPSDHRYITSTCRHDGDVHKHGVRTKLAARSFPLAPHRHTWPFPPKLANQTRQVVHLQRRKGGIVYNNVIFMYSRGEQAA